MHQYTTKFAGQGINANLAVGMLEKAHRTDQGRGMAYSENS